MEFKTVTFNKNEPWARDWHFLYLTKEEAARVFVDYNGVANLWRRDGGNWRRAYPDSYCVLRYEIDMWMRGMIGHMEGEVWECDRYYHPHEKLPELPKGGGRGAWKAVFRCWPDEKGMTIDNADWSCGGHVDIQNPKRRAFIRFADKDMAALFATLFLAGE